MLSVLSFVFAMAATVPAPRPIVVTDLPSLTNWSPVIAADDTNPALAFTVDLDYLAPLGTGMENGADWLSRDGERAVDQSRMQFTAKPDAKVIMTLGRSFAERAKSAPNRDAAKADYRRTLRLGRLLWQERASTEQDLLGIALIKIGAEGLYDVAHAEGDAATMAVAAIVHAEATNFREAIRDRLIDRERSR